MLTRGAKKAKQDAVPTSDDLINVFKDRKDPVKNNFYYNIGD